MVPFLHGADRTPGPLLGRNRPFLRTGPAALTTLVNGSDDKLLAAFLDPANGCTDFHATDPTDPTGASGSQALNELSARVNQQGTIAAVPPNDEMTLVGGAFSIVKTNVAILPWWTSRCWLVTSTRRRSRWTTARTW